jgi:hypothetical protein
MRLFSDRRGEGSCQERQKYCREPAQYLAKLSFPPIIFNIFPPSFFLTRLSQHSDSFHHPERRLDTTPDHESKVVEPKRAHSNGSWSLLHRGEVRPEQNEPYVLEEERDNRIEIPDQDTGSQGSSCLFWVLPGGSAPSNHWYHLPGFPSHFICILLFSPKNIFEHVPYPRFQFDDLSKPGMRLLPA